MEQAGTLIIVLSFSDTHREEVEKVFDVSIGQRMWPTAIVRFVVRSLVVPFSS